MGVSTGASMKRAVVIGAGPAGLTAAYELLRRSNREELDVVVLEESDKLGGISRTVEYHGNRMDMGGHRFFTKVPEVNAWWDAMLPRQGAPASDDIALHREVTLRKGGPDPQTEDRVMLRRSRVSRILFNGHFFDYPITLKLDTFRNMGLWTTLVAGFSYLKSVFFKREERSLEDFYINRFGKKLYSMFFEHYTENLWGRHPSQIDPSWGAQRVKGLSIFAVLKNALEKQFGKKNRRVETSLIEEFSYPKLGPGQLWDVTGEEILRLGGQILRGARVVGIRKNGEDHITQVIYEQDGERRELSCDHCVSSMPIRDLVAGMNDVPSDPARIAAGLPYRDYMTVGVLVPKLNLKNETGRRTIGNIVPDNWIYIHDRTVRMGRMQIYNNWSPYLIRDLEHTVWVGLEYFCNEGDSLWSMRDEDFARLGIREMKTLGMIDRESDVLDFHVERVKKAYPAYFDTYDEMDRLVDYLNSIDNLYCVGRNGQHRYNNIDHSMCTSFEAVKCILSGERSRDRIWGVNTDKEYHEGK